MKTNNQLKLANSSKEPWYRDGLPFQCTECGKCCSGPKGYIFVSEDEISEMSHFLKISNDLFKRKYLRKIGSRYALTERKSRERPDEYDCVFLQNKKCTVYGARPIQCRTYPWWPENLNSKESFELASLECEGINQDAPLVSYEEIQKNLQSNPKTLT